MNKNVVQGRFWPSKRHGFTLIELLVVVLIIGILAAVALPQYQKAVIRAETRKMILDVKAIGEAQHSYYVEHGSYPQKFSDLDVMPNGYPSTDCSNFTAFAKTDCISNENSALFLAVSGKIFALFNQGKYRHSGFVYDAGKIYCYHSTSSGTLCTQVLNCTFDHNVGNPGDNTYFTCPSL